MPAIIHPGAVIHCWDHLVITLTEEVVGAATVAETGFLSLYAITYSASLGSGHVAIVEAGDVVETFTDDPGLGERQQRRLVGMGDRRAALRRPPIIATFERRPYGPDGFGYRLSSARARDRGSLGGHRPAVLGRRSRRRASTLPRTSGP